jgi:hypothetical protein
VLPVRILRKVLKAVLVVIVLFAVWSVFRIGTPVTAFRREIVVNVPREVAWDHFSRPRAWQSWLGSGAPTEVGPGDVVGPDTVASFGDSVTFRMAEFDPPNHWMWMSRMLWFTARYDHVFERITDHQTRMIFHMRITGFGNDLFARVIGAATAASGHAEALQRLADEMNRLPAATQSTYRR